MFSIGIVARQGVLKDHPSTGFANDGCTPASRQGEFCPRNVYDLRCQLRFWGPGYGLDQMMGSDKGRFGHV